MRLRPLQSLKILLKLCLVALLALGLFSLSQEPMLLIGCDCQTFTLASPSPASQIIWLCLFALMLLVPTRPLWYPVRLAVALIAALLSSHRLVMDSAHARIDDIYALATIQLALFDPGGGIAVTTHRLNTVITGISPTTGPLTIFSPPETVGLNRTQLKALADP